MTEKICARCGTYTPAGKYCPECGQQLYPDVGRTVWDVMGREVRLCLKPKFDVWTGKRLV